VVERLRALAERPLDRDVARAVLALGLAVTIGLSLLASLASVGHGDNNGSSRASAPDHSGGGYRPYVAARIGPRREAPRSSARPEQDPQDRRGSLARRRAVAELESRRALQHVPYKDGRFAVELVGVRGTRSVLRVTAPTVRAARSGWRTFLRRFDDKGAAYLPIFGDADARAGGGG
jgi:hypothetical protein